MTAIDRRTLLALLAAGVAETHLEAAAGRLLAWQAARSPYRPSFFTTDEHRLVDEGSELILPATSRSPGARAARVADYLDLVVAHSPAETQQAWRRELAALDARARDVRGHFGETVYQTVIPRNVRVSEAPSYGKPALVYDLKCAGSQAYLKLAREVVVRERDRRAKAAA